MDETKENSRGKPCCRHRFGVQMIAQMNLFRVPMIDHLTAKLFPMIAQMNFKPFSMIDHRKQFEIHLSDHRNAKTMSMDELSPTVLGLVISLAW